MSIIKKIAIEIIASKKKILINNELSLSCNKLVKFNNGFFKSDKQSLFFKNQIFYNGKETTIKISDKEIGIIGSELKEDYNRKTQWLYFLDDKGISRQVTRWWKLIKGLSKDKIDIRYRSMPFKQQEQVGELLLEEMKDRWEFAGDKTNWRRNE